PCSLFFLPVRRQDRATWLTGELPLAPTPAGESSRSSRGCWKAARTLGGYSMAGIPQGYIPDLAVG
ncbi:MAG: hypothetical protein J6B03_04850, partial [Candidatus Homeothermus sp.]|nr:hypothetical protein [Candidatus Homeothermus sp.]